MSTILRTQGLTKKYGDQYAVKDLCLNVKKGEIYGFLGRNGAGKTTTIRMLLGLITPTDGEIEVFGEGFKKNKKQILSRIGSIVETAGFYGNLNALENLSIYAKLIGVKKNNAIEEVLELVGLLDEKKKLVKKYSLGMKQRLGIARAILHSPELLILDEPTNGLDPVGIKETRKLLKTLAEKRDITIFMSSHILSEVQQLATTIGIIHEGKLLEEIKLEELRKQNRRYIEAQVSDTGRSVLLLEREFNIHDYQVHDDNIIRIYTRHDDIAEINRTFNDNDIFVSRLGLSEDNLEDYFLRLTGGEIIG